MAKDFKSPEDRRHLLDDYKQKIYNQFWTRLDNPRMANNAHVGKIIADFEKTAPTPKELVELLLHRVALPMKSVVSIVLERLPNDISAPFLLKMTQFIILQWSQLLGKTYQNDRALLV